MVKKVHKVKFLNNQKSKVALSSRRFLFNFVSNKDIWSDGFHVDYMSGGGSGILIKYKSKYFVLTAYHVIKEMIENPLQNSSPFWIRSKEKLIESINDFLMPKKIWFIGELIPEVKGWQDYTDVVFIEMFDPHNNFAPDNYVDITQKGECTEILSSKKFFEDQVLAVSGYPLEANLFEFEVVPEGYTHATNLQRHHDIGVCLFDEYRHPYIDYEKCADKFAGITYDHNGMSGGAIYNFEPNSKARLVGMVLSGNNKIIRFIPISKILSQIRNYDNASFIILDYEEAVFKGYLETSGVYCVETMQTCLDKMLSLKGDYDSYKDWLKNRKLKNPSVGYF
ncbi:hypothetical protein RFI02_11700 [Acinetobacter sichuanensis]|uniref:hypothetical protein n=1 Tax=Acinetobacter sichuanensis TaxID=2136183 RepID=UPI00280FBBE8|nr:hypothetical protein [Acinetobacter sichuanensis]MDQ9021773.1 hypothetical protein [Acinetobacter sichuanensis]